jgi:hypothetical protein
MKKWLLPFSMVVMVFMFATPIVSAAQESQIVPGIEGIHSQTVAPSASSCVLVSITKSVRGNDGIVRRYSYRNPPAYPEMFPVSLWTGEVALVSMRALYRGPENSLGMITVYDNTAKKIIAARTLPANKVSTLSILQPIWSTTEGTYEFYIEIWGNGKQSLYGIRSIVNSPT